MMHLIKLTTVGGDIITTRINGTRNEIIAYYHKNNWRMAPEDVNRIKFIEFLEIFEMPGVGYSEPVVQLIC